MSNENIFVHPLATCESNSIGNGTRIWPFTHIMQDSSIGDDCNIGEHVFIESGVQIGNRVTIKNGVQIWSGISIENDVFIGPNTTFTNDKYPKSKNKNFKLLPTLVKQGASIGANATILPGLIINEYAVIGAGSVVTKNVGAYQTVYGNPAQTKLD